MAKRSSNALNAQKLKWILVGIIILGVVVGVSGAVYLNGLLTTKVAETNDAMQSSQLSNSNLELAQALKTYLEKHDEDVQNAARIVAQTTSYHFQNQIVEDVTRYANASGITIVGIDFPQDISSATVDKSTGLKSLSATIRIADGAKYTGYLRFLKYIEQNLTKMQVTEISITPNAADQGYINNTTIGIQVYVQ